MLWLTLPDATAAQGLDGSLATAGAVGTLVLKTWLRAVLLPFVSSSMAGVSLLWFSFSTLGLRGQKDALESQGWVQCVYTRTHV